MTGGSKEKQAQLLDFWLTRVKHLFANSKSTTMNESRRHPPPIILNFIWGFRAADDLENLASALDQNMMSYMGPVIASYLALGWDIAVIDVGPTISKISALQDNIELLFDDVHHPSCDGVKYIADMIIHSVFTNMAIQCYSETYNDNGDGKDIRDNNHDGIPPKLWTKHNLSESIHTNGIMNTLPSINELWMDLYSEDAILASLTPWEPRLSGPLIK